MMFRRRGFRCEKAQGAAAATRGGPDQRHAVAHEQLADLGRMAIERGLHPLAERVVAPPHGRRPSPKV
jgi:hypothetical protein